MTEYINALVFLFRIMSLGLGMISFGSFFSGQCWVSQNGKKQHNLKFSWQKKKNAFPSLNSFLGKFDNIQ